MAKYFYARVSTADGKQDHERQLYLLEKSGHTVDKVYTEKKSGKNMNRPVLQECLDKLQRGDIFIVSELNRLSRSLVDMLTIVKELNDKGVELITLDGKYDTTTPQGRMMVNLMAVFAEYERENIVQRVRDGVAAAQARGVKFGRSIDTEKRSRIREYITAPEWHGSAVRTAQELSVNYRTVMRAIEELECVAV